jgi:hypothetical protein
MPLKEEDKADDIDDNDLEETEEEVFDALPPTERAKRSTNYMDLEDTCLVGSEGMSLNAVAGNDQIGKQYGNKIKDKFHRIMPNQSGHKFRLLQG